jgi:hypothetical protein
MDQKKLTIYAQKTRAYYICFLIVTLLCIIFLLSIFDSYSTLDCSRQKTEEIKCKLETSNIYDQKKIELFNLKDIEVKTFRPSKNDNGIRIFLIADNRKIPFFHFGTVEASQIFVFIHNNSKRSLHIEYIANIKGFILTPSCVLIIGIPFYSFFLQFKEALNPIKLVLYTSRKSGRLKKINFNDLMAMDVTLSFDKDLGEFNLTKKSFWFKQVIQNWSFQDIVETNIFETKDKSGFERYILELRNSLGEKVQLHLSSRYKAESLEKKIHNFLEPENQW